MILPGLTDALAHVAFNRVELSQWHTPDNLALSIARWCRDIIGPNTTILEPSAGGGAFLRAALDVGASPANLTAIELDPRWATRLTDEFPSSTVEHRDYLTRPIRDHFDICLMNPPYEKGADGRFLDKALQESERVIALVRTVALNGAERHERVWSRCGPGAPAVMRRLVLFRTRPSFGSTADADGAKSDFCVVDISRRTDADPFHAPTLVAWW